MLRVNQLVTAFRLKEGTVRAVDGISFEVSAKKSLGLVGESGCGKSVTALSIMRLLTPPGYVESGEIWLQSRNLPTLSEAEMRDVRGQDIAMIFQEPATSLNPVYTVGKQIAEALLIHDKANRKQSREIAISLLDRVGVPAPHERIDAYPHQLSGGMKQRVMIAIALACKPKVLLADEPTTALDVTIQAQILDLLDTLQQDMGMSVLLITHDLGIVAQHVHEVCVMYAGRVVERAPTLMLFENPSHPYTRGLLASMPPPITSQRVRRLKTISGVVPSLDALPRGCRFQDRCPEVMNVCRQVDPELRAVEPMHTAACHLVQGDT